VQPFRAIPTPARWLLVATAVVWLLAELRQSTHHRPEGVTAAKGSAMYVRGFTAVGVVGAIVVARTVPSTTMPSGVAWVGLVLLWCGVALRLWSFRTLGRYFTFTVQTSADQPVITDGPYRVVRHPSYAGILLAVMGIGLCIGNWLSFAVLTAFVTCGVVFRIRVEERALLQELGEPYRAYAAEHKRLVPFVW
jgi:protein-S-isoprenylcysteine O-methyltransferase Ste14